MTMTTTAPLSFAAVETAAEAIAAHLPVTPSWSYPMLNQTAGTEVVIKHENVQPTGAFKIRGGLNFALSVDPRLVTGGIITTSTGNHAQSTAYAGRKLGVPTTVVMPEGSCARKVAAVESFGATVRCVGATLAEASTFAADEAARTGAYLLSPGDEPAILLGHATIYHELFTAHPDLDAVYVPIGSGTGAAGACLARNVLAPDCAVIGVQSAASPAAYESWRAGRLVSHPSQSCIAGVATACGYQLPQSVLRTELDDFLLVSDEEILDACATYARDAHTLAEGAGAVGLAGLLTQRRGDKIATVCTGGNATDDELRRL